MVNGLRVVSINLGIMGKSKTSRFYASNPEARAKRLAYQKEYNKKPENMKKIMELTKYNRKKGVYGNGDGLDASHRGGKIVGYEKASVNRSRNGKGSVRQGTGKRSNRG